MRQARKQYAHYENTYNARPGRRYLANPKVIDVQS